ncbi:hypothetical protein QQF54_01645 [Lelliottia sp. V106_10]|uniref:hypothetical protein n=1 Tax=Lelliottia wanjuensis TaxID=3050585 RepID=UPI00254EAD67|nr:MULTISPECIES: hypothetical protein [unclassified Lelliottia]MDK9354849.1 hypothetical protein [Lelliottia sp. V106_16]MDK9372056.1 hypothetical protein [Lelliottia sp. V106_10]MDK9598693.1 hypothetical protein [Lelliottia sp. V106_5]
MDNSENNYSSKISQSVQPASMASLAKNATTSVDANQTKRFSHVLWRSIAGKAGLYGIVFCGNRNKEAHMLRADNYIELQRVWLMLMNLPV